MLAEIAPGASIAGVFTRSATRSGPVLWCEEKLAALRRGRRRAASRSSSTRATPTPSPARTAARRSRATAGAAAAALGVPVGHVFVASTGVIGEPLPAERIVAVMGALRDGLAAGRRRAGGAGDHDHRHLSQGRGGAGRARRRAGDDHGLRQGLGDDRARHGDDAGLSLHRRRGRPGHCCRRWCRGPRDETFNCITVDGDTSTSDTLIMAATGRAAMAPLGRSASRGPRAFAAALRGVMRDLAQQVVRDGEGATKFVEVRGDRRRERRRTRGKVGALDRQLAAGQDRDRRRGSELGPRS